MRIIALFLVLVFALQPLNACSPGVTLQRLGPETGSYTLSSGILDAQQIVISDARTFESLWRTIHAKRRPLPELPDIDFDQNSAIVVAAGQQSSGGVEILIERVYEDHGIVLIDVTTIRPAKGCIVSTGLTQPIDIAITAKIDQPYEFHPSARVRSCD